MEKHILITLVILGALVDVLQTQSTSMMPCSSQQSPYKGPTLPTLPDQFQVHVEANIVQKQLTRNIVEYYDYTNNRAVIDSYRKTTGERVRTARDFNTQEARTIYENGTCTFWQTNSSSGHFSFLKAENGSHIKTVKELLYFGEDMGEKFIGFEQVRGIMVKHWQACVSIPATQGTFTLDYYFSNGSDYTIDGAEVQVPVRAVINGTGHAMSRNRTVSPDVHSFYHIYEFTDFHPGPIKDQSVFEIPIGIYCHSDENRRPAPELPQQFSVGLETMPHTSMGNMPVLNEQMYYDGLSGVMRVDLTSLTDLRDVQKYGNNPISVIYDMKNKMRYIIDKWEGNCTVTEIRADLKMVTPEDILSDFDKSFLYQGRKTYKGMTVESWAYYEAGMNMTEVLLKQMPPVPSTHDESLHDRRKRVPVPGRGAYAVYAPMGIYSRRVGAGNQAEEIFRYNLYGFSQSHPGPDVFDVSTCYQTDHHYSFMMIKTEGSFEIDVLHHRGEFVSAVRSAIARGAGVSVMRVTSVMVEADRKTANQLLVYFQLLDNSISGHSNNNLPNLATAKLNLQSAIANGLNFDVSYPTIEENFEVHRDSLWEIRSTMDSSPMSSSIQRYSAGAMAGLGIAMVVIGALLGLGGAYIIYKRIDTTVPYEITK